VHYCERLDGAFWAEPVNAVTNLAFIVAGLALVLLLRRRPRASVPWEAWLLTALVLAIGVGSFLWHTLATLWSAAADVLPIALYINVFLVSYLVRAARVRWWVGVLWFAAFHGLGVALAWATPPGFLNGSVGYLPAWLGLAVMALYSRTRGHAGAGLLAAAVAVVTLSLILRSVDNALCARVPVGTHFLWHLLNGVVLYLTTRFVIDWPRARTPVGGKGDGGIKV
jgi:hypothetical protein